MTKRDNISMQHPDGRPWTAESEVEAMELMAHGYRRLDDGEQAPPADGEKPGGKNPPAKPAA